METKNKLVESKKERTDIIIAVIVVLFAAGFIFLKIFKKSPDTEIAKTTSTESVFKQVVINEQLVSNDTLVVLEQETSSFLDEIRYDEEYVIENKQIHPISTIITSITAEKSDVDTADNNLEEAETPITKKVSTMATHQESIEDVVPENTISNSQNEQVIPKANEDFKEKAQNTALKIDDELSIINKKTHTTTETPVTSVISNVSNKDLTDCTVIVGVFRESKNEVAIIEKLTKLGYTYDKGVMNNGLTYVGVPVMCTNKAKRTRLINELNTAFSVRAWLRKK